MELWAACSNETAIVEGKQKALDEKLAFTTVQSTTTEKAPVEQKKMVDEWKTHMDDCKKDYKDNLDSFPGAYVFQCNPTTRLLNFNCQLA